MSTSKRPCLNPQIQLLPSGVLKKVKCIVTSQFIEIKKPIHYLKWNIMVEMVHVCGQILRPFCIFSLIFASSDKVENQVEYVDDVFEMD